MIIILLLLVVTAYLTTAYFVKFWPFKPVGSSSQRIDLTAISDNAKDKDKSVTDADLTKGVVDEGKGTYDLSDGKPYDCGQYLMAFPKGWIRINKENGLQVTGTNPDDPTDTVLVTQTEGLVVDDKNLQQTVDGIISGLGEGYKAMESNTMDFLGRKCLLVSGTAVWNGTTAGLYILGVPDEKGPDFIVVGLYDTKKQESRGLVMDAMVSITPKTLK